MAAVEERGSPEEEKHLNGEVLLDPEEREGAAGPGAEEGAKKKRKKKKKSKGAAAGRSWAGQGDGEAASGASHGDNFGGGGEAGAKPPWPLRRSGLKGAGWVGGRTSPF